MEIGAAERAIAKRLYFSPWPIFIHSAPTVTGQQRNVTSPYFPAQAESQCQVSVFSAARQENDSARGIQR